MSKVILTAKKLTKTWTEGETQICALDAINFQVMAGESIAIIGPSGSGKSTLLHLLGGLDTPTSGDVLLKGESYLSMNEKKRAMMRNRHLGFVYQFHHLLPELTALENVAMPLLLQGLSVLEASKKSSQILTNVGLSLRLSHKPAELSGGERQRVAIARAMVHCPSCLLADEPTGNLDSVTTSTVLELMLSLNQSQKTALVIVTHDEKLARKMDRVCMMQDGVLKS